MGSNQRQLIGTVVRDKMQKTVVVMTSRRIQHPRYRKYISVRKKFKAHDENNDAKYGDRVIIQETRPLSKEKRWVVRKIVERAESTAKPAQS